jgi:hypothetical protein
MLVKYDLGHDRVHPQRWDEQVQRFEHYTLSSERLNYSVEVGRVHHFSSSTLV